VPGALRAWALVGLLGASAGCRPATVDTGDPTVALPEPEPATSAFGLYNGLNRNRSHTESLDEALAWIAGEPLPEMLELGMGLSRIHQEDGLFSFSWHAVDPDRDGGGFDFRWTDALVELACDEGITLLPTVIGTPWYEASAAAFMPDAEAWRAAMIDTVERYDGDDVFRVDPDSAVPNASVADAIRACPIHRWMAGNEPDLYADVLPDWCDAACYRDFLTLAQDAVQTADPDGLLLYGGLSWGASTDPGRWTFFEDTVTSTDFDELAVHIYPQPIDLGGVLGFFQDLEAVVGDGGFWITEAGFGSLPQPSSEGAVETNSSQLSQARQVVSTQLMAAAHGAPAVLLLGVHGPGPESPNFYGYGLLDSDTAEPNLSWWSYQRMTDLLADADLGATQVLLEEPESGRFGWTAPTPAGALSLLTWDPASLPDYAPGGALDPGPATFTLTGVAGQVQLLAAVPDGETGAVAGVTWHDTDLGQVDGELTVEVGLRPVWVVIDE